MGAKSSKSDVADNADGIAAVVARLSRADLQAALATPAGTAVEWQRIAAAFRASCVDGSQLCERMESPQALRGRLKWHCDLGRCSRRIRQTSGTPVRNIFD